MGGPHTRGRGGGDVRKCMCMARGAGMPGAPPVAGVHGCVGAASRQPACNKQPRQRRPAERLAQYSAALRCEWPLVAQWTCDDCGLQGTQILDSYVISPQYDSSSDAYTVRPGCACAPPPLAAPPPGCPAAATSPHAAWRPAAARCPLALDGRRCTTTQSSRAWWSPSAPRMPTWRAG